MVDVSGYHVSISLLEIYGINEQKSMSHLRRNSQCEEVNKLSIYITKKKLRRQSKHDTLIEPTSLIKVLRGSVLQDYGGGRGLAPLRAL